MYWVGMEISEQVFSQTAKRA
jgi:hypothetical protein